MVAKPISTDTTAPRPGTKPPSPTTSAVSTKNSMPMPVSEPTLFCRAANRKPAKPTIRPDST